MSWLPEPVPLDFPPGDPEALADVLDTTTGAAFWLGVLDAHLGGPAAAAPPGWLGADAVAATAQIATVAQLTGRVHAALAEALSRLAAHHEVLLHARARVLGLREAQREDFARVVSMRDAVVDPEAAPTAIPELIEAEAGRRRVYAALLAEVADDAAATSRVLAGSAAPVGGSARPGDADRVTATLAALLPGWGEPELAALGRRAGLAARTSSAEEVGAQLADDAALLRSARYAVAWLSALGPDGFLILLKAVGVSLQPGSLPESLATLVAAALPAAARGGEPRLQRVLDKPLREPLEPETAVGLGRLAQTGALPSSYLARMVPVLVDGERMQPDLRDEELSVAGGEDPLAATLGALADTGDADTAAQVLASTDVWALLLSRIWSEGLTEIDRLVRLSIWGDAADATTAAALDAVGGAAEVIVTQVSAGSPEAFSLMSLSPAVGTLVAAHLPVVTDTIAVGLTVDGVAGRPLEPDELRMLAGLGMVSLDPEARSSVLRALVQAMADAPPPVGPGAQSVAAYAHGGVFAAMTFGEAQQIRQTFYSAVTIAENQQLSWDVITAPLGWIKLAKLARTWEVGTSLTTFYGPGGVPLDDFLRQPATGGRQAEFSAVVASMPTLVAAGLAPDPGTALDQGLGSPQGSDYVRDLEPAQREIWDDVSDKALRGYQEVGDALGILPGSGPR